MHHIVFSFNYITFNEISRILLCIAAHIIYVECFPIIQISQYACDYENLAPSGCTQYFFGALSGLVRSYNYKSSTEQQHLANQKQVICVR